MIDIDLQGEPPGLKEIEAERAELENTRLLIMQNEVYVANLYRKLLLKILILFLLLAFTVLLYFFLPPGIFGIVNGRTFFLVSLSVVLVSSITWIGWKSVVEARSVIPGRDYSKQQLRLLESNMQALGEIDTKRILNVKNWSRRDGVLYEYMKQVVRQRRHPIGIEYDAVKAHIKKISMGKDTK